MYLEGIAKTYIKINTIYHVVFILGEERKGHILGFLYFIFLNFTGRESVFKMKLSLVFELLLIFILLAFAASMSVSKYPGLYIINQ